MTDENYVSFGKIARRLGSQAQYCSRYLDGLDDHPYLGENIRIRGNTSDYHSLEIHRDDVALFVRRYEEYIAWRDDPDLEGPMPKFC